MKKEKDFELHWLLALVLFTGSIVPIFIGFIIHQPLISFSGFSIIPTFGLFRAIYYKFTQSTSPSEPSGIWVNDENRTVRKATLGRIDEISPSRYSH